MDPPIGIRALGYRLGSCVLSLEELAARGLLASPPEVLRSFGFDQVHMVGNDDERRDLALVVATELLRDHAIDRRDVDALLLFGGLPPECPAHAVGAELIELFRYPVGRLQHELGL